MDTKLNTSQALAAAITKAASKQTYYTIRLFVDREHVDDAYRAYGYFRWVDDVLDAEALVGEDAGTRPVLPAPVPQAQVSDIVPFGEVEAAEKIAFVNRQKSLLEACYRGDMPDVVCVEERMLVDLVHHDNEQNSGLKSYLRNMMNVMIFDAQRRGRIISQAELCEYSRMLATAVTEALHYFIGHDNPTPRHEARYLAVTAAHITHMLRDAIEDAEAGYFNVPHEYLQTHGVSPQDVESWAYRAWVCQRVGLARTYFKAGRECTAQVKSLRCRLAGYAYTARFEWMLRTIERDNYCLHSEYPGRKSLWAGLWMGWMTLVSIFAPTWLDAGSRDLGMQVVRMREL